MQHAQKIVLEKWIPIIAASQSVKCNQHDRERLLSWSNVGEFTNKKRRISKMKVTLCIGSSCHLKGSKTGA